MVNQAIAKLLSDLALECFKLGVDEFDYLAGFDIDQMVMVCFGRGLIASAAIAKIVAVKNACLFKQANSTINRGDRNARINGDRALMQFFNVRVVGTFRQHLGDNAPLLRDAEATFGT